MRYAKRYSTSCRPRPLQRASVELESDDAVAILEDMPKDEQAEILEQLPQPERVALARSLDYPEDSAGRRMQTEFIAVPPTWNVGQAIDYMRETIGTCRIVFSNYMSPMRRADFAARCRSIACCEASGRCRYPI